MEMLESLNLWEQGIYIVFLEARIKYDIYNTYSNESPSKYYLSFLEYCFYQSWNFPQSELIRLPISYSTCISLLVQSKVWGLLHTRALHIVEIWTLFHCFWLSESSRWWWSIVFSQVQGCKNFQDRPVHVKVFSVCLSLSQASVQLNLSLNLTGPR